MSVHNQIINTPTVCVLSRTANRFRATHTAVNPADLLPSGAAEEKMERNNNKDQWCGADGY